MSNLNKRKRTYSKSLGMAVPPDGVTIMSTEGLFYNIDDWKTVNKVANGIAIWVDAKNVGVMSLRHSDYLQFLTHYITIDIEDFLGIYGYESLTYPLIDTFGSKAAAAYYAVNYVWPDGFIGGTLDWRLSEAGSRSSIVNQALEVTGGDRLSENNYWIDEMESSKHAVYLEFSSNTYETTWNYDVISSTNRVRPIRLVDISS